MSAKESPLDEWFPGMIPETDEERRARCLSPEGEPIAFYFPGGVRPFGDEVALAEAMGRSRPDFDKWWRRAAASIKWGAEPAMIPDGFDPAEWMPLSEEYIHAQRFGWMPFDDAEL